jgi:hypothetical protein
MILQIFGKFASVLIVNAVILNIVLKHRLKHVLRSLAVTQPF